MTDIALVYALFPDEASARNAARTVVSERLAACAAPQFLEKRTAATLAHECMGEHRGVRVGEVMSDHRGPRRSRRAADQPLRVGELAGGWASRRSTDAPASPS